MLTSGPKRQWVFNTALYMLAPLAVGGVLGLIGSVREKAELLIILEVIKGATSTAIIGIWFGLMIGTGAGALFGIAYGLSAGLEEGGNPTLLGFCVLTSLVTGGILQKSPGCLKQMITNWHQAVIQFIKAMVIVLAILVLCGYMMAIIPAALIIELDRQGVSILKLGVSTFLGFQINLWVAIPAFIGFFLFYGLFTTILTTLCIGWQTGRWIVGAGYGLGLGALLGMAIGFARAIEDGIFQPSAAPGGMAGIFLQSMLAMNRSLPDSLHFILLFAVPFHLIRIRINERAGVLTGSIMASQPVFIFMDVGYTASLVVYVLFLLIGYAFARFLTPRGSEPSNLRGD